MYFITSIWTNYTKFLKNNRAQNNNNINHAIVLDFVNDKFIFVHSHGNNKEKEDLGHDKIHFTKEDLIQ